MLVNYDTIVRPVKNSNDQIKLSLGVKLSQIADIVIKDLCLKFFVNFRLDYFTFKDERNQIMTTNIWIRHVNIVFIYRILAKNQIIMLELKKFILFFIYIKKSLTIILGMA